MPSCFLKRVLPFALTFMLGATLGGLFGFKGSTPQPSPTFAPAASETDSGYRPRHCCLFTTRHAFAETKPLNILFVPEASLPSAYLKGTSRSVRVVVHFGSDGSIRSVRQLDAVPRALAREAERAAWQIQFEPEMEDGVPFSTFKEVVINFQPE